MRRRRKKRNIKLIGFGMMIGLFFVSNAYAMLSDRLTISGTASIKYNQELALAEHEIYEPMQETPNYSNCTYTYKNVSNWKQADGTYIYEVELSIINLDKDYNTGNLEISFEEKQGLAKEQSKENLGILQAKTVLITGSKITALLTEENSRVKYGDKINLTIYLTYEKEQTDGITIENVTLNGNKLVEAKEETIEENTDTNIETKEPKTTNTKTETLKSENADNDSKTNNEDVENYKELESNYEKENKQ